MNNRWAVQTRVQYILFQFSSFLYLFLFCLPLALNFTKVATSEGSTMTTHSCSAPDTHWTFNTSSASKIFSSLGFKSVFYLLMNMVVKRPLLLSRSWPHVNQGLCFSVNHVHVQILSSFQITYEGADTCRTQKSSGSSEGTGWNNIAFHKRQNQSAGLPTPQVHWPTRMDEKEDWWVLRNRS